MNYVIKNHKNVYIRLNKNGVAVTCAEHEKTLFEEQKRKFIYRMAEEDETEDVV